MPGAFTHITAINILLSADTMMTLVAMPAEAKRILATYSSYAELGAVSPDYPFAAVSDMEQNYWVDLMHDKRVDELIRSLIYRVKMLPIDQKERCFAWLAGFVSHLVMDITIHPIIDKSVGSYCEHKTALQHQLCEIHQDTYIWQRLGFSYSDFSQRLQRNMSACSDSSDPELLDPAIRDLWSIALTEVYSEYANQCMPKINYWHNKYLSNIDSATEDMRLFPLFQHTEERLTYPSVEHINYSYICNLKSPEGDVHYDDIFDRALENVSYCLTKLALAVFENGDDQLFSNRDFLALY